MVQLSASMEQTHEMQLAQLYDVLGFRWVIARYDVLSTLHETGSCMTDEVSHLSNDVSLHMARG